MNLGDHQQAKKPRVMQLIYTLSHGGAERLALTILDGLRNGNGPEASGFVCGAFGDGGPLAEAADALAIPHDSLRFEMGKIRGMRALARAIRENRVDVLHVQSGYLLQLAYLPARITGTRIVYTEHAKHALQNKKRLRRVVQLLGRRTDAVTTVSRNLKDFFVDDLGFDDEAVTVVHNAVDTERFRPEGESERGRSIPSRPTIIGTVARMTEAKDHGNLLRAFSAVLKRDDDTLLALVGDGETRGDVERMVREYGLSERVLFLGRQERVPEFLRAMDVFVLPSKREGAPISVLEAMACGIPVVATDVGGVGEIIEDGVNGRVVPPQDHEALSDALCWLLDRPETMRRFAVSGPAEVRRRFSREALCRNYRTIYEQVMRDDRIRS